jgi:hypothetical protein
MRLSTCQLIIVLGVAALLAISGIDIPNTDDDEALTRVVSTRMTRLRVAVSPTPGPPTPTTRAILEGEASLSRPPPRWLSLSDPVVEKRSPMIDRSWSSRAPPALPAVRARPSNAVLRG